jgi:hypothetical protein
MKNRLKNVMFNATVELTLLASIWILFQALPLLAADNQPTTPSPLLGKPSELSSSVATQSASLENKTVKSAPELFAKNWPADSPIGVIENYQTEIRSLILDYANNHAGTMATQKGKLNPYKLGIELYRDIEDRWNKGRFGREWDQCDDLRTRRSWDKKLGEGRQKIFEVRKHYNDVTFIDEFLTPEFAIEQKLFVFNFNDNYNKKVKKEN